MSGKRTTKGEAWGILNPYGDLWGYQTFETAEIAKAYVARFWKGIPKVNLDDFKPVRVTVQLTTIQEPRREHQ